MKKIIHVLYFAYLREQAGTSSETIETKAENFLELYEELRAKHGFTLLPDVIRVAVNQTYTPLTSLLKDQDQIAFLPPVSGG